MSSAFAAGYRGDVPRRSPHAHGPSEIWSRTDVRQQIDAIQAGLSARLRAVREERGLTQEQAAEKAGLHAKHVQRIERGIANATVATVAALAFAYDVSLDSLFAAPGPRLPFSPLDPQDARPYDNCVPLFSLRAAAGRFGPSQLVERETDPQAWVVPHGRTAIGPGLFVARVVGESMNRRIPNGAYCLFRAPVPQLRSGQVLLVQLREAQEPDLGGRYSVKVLRLRARRVVLEPDSRAPGFEPLVLPESDAFSAVAELVEVLPGT